jgi:hypothetical protein
MVIDKNDAAAKAALKLQSAYEGLVFEGGDDTFRLLLPGGGEVAIANVALNELRGADRVIRGTVEGLDVGMMFRPTDQPKVSITVMARQPPDTASAEVSLVGRWNPTVVEYLPSDDDGGFSDEGYGETMDAADLLDRNDHVEFHADGTYTGAYWGSEQKGTWTRDGAKVSVTIWNTTETWSLFDGGQQLVRADEDEEHGRAYEIYYKRA